VIADEEEFIPVLLLKIASKVELEAGEVKSIPSAK